MMTVTAETSVRRGRHRRPRPRKLLFAVGGLALAAGALSLVRVAPDSGSGGLGTAEADPVQDPGTDRSGNAVAAVEAAPRVSPSATRAMGGASTAPTAPSALTPAHTATTSPNLATAPDTTTIPVTPNTPAPTTAQQPPATAAPAPQPSQTPGRTTPSSTPQPGRTDEPGLCLPVIGLCANPLAAP